MLRKTYPLLLRFNFNPKSYSGAPQEGQSELSREPEISRELLEQCSASRLAGEMRLLYQKPFNKSSKPGSHPISSIEKLQFVGCKCDEFICACIVKGKRIPERKFEEFDGWNRFDALEPYQSL